MRCQFCTEGKSGVLDDGGMRAEFRIEWRRGRWWLHVRLGDGQVAFSSNMMANYCPLCGRKLGGGVGW